MLSWGFLGGCTCYFRLSRRTLTYRLFWVPLCFECSHAQASEPPDPFERSMQPLISRLFIRTYWGALVQVGDEDGSSSFRGWDRQHARSFNSKGRLSVPWGGWAERRSSLRRPRATRTPNTRRGRGQHGRSRGKGVCPASREPEAPEAGRAGCVPATRRGLSRLVRDEQGGGEWMCLPLRNDHKYNISFKFQEPFWPPIRRLSWDFHVCVAIEWHIGQEEDFNSEHCY